MSKTKRSKATIKPWERRDSGESQDAHSLFLAYRNMEGGRSLSRLRDTIGEGSGKTPSLRSLETLSSRHEWVDRVLAWDNHLQAQRDRELAKDAAKWERRKLAEAERVWEMSQALGKQFEAGIKFPLSRQTVEKKEGPNGSILQIITVEPARWTLRDIATIGELSARLAAAALAAVGKDPAAMSDAELDSVANAGLDLDAESGAA